MAVSIHSELDAVVVGSGPNGLAAAITLAQEGLSVRVIEAQAEPGGGTRTRELTLPGFFHDVCSAIHPMAVLSPFFRTLRLEERGVRWVRSPVSLAHPLDTGEVALLEESVEATANGLGSDRRAYLRALAPLVRDADRLWPQIFEPLALPRHPLALGRFGLSALRSVERFARARFERPLARALFAGCGAHSFLPLDAPVSAAFALVLLMAGHTVGWPCAEGGSATISHALVETLSSFGGSIQTGLRVASWDDLPRARAVLFDTSPSTMLRICGDRMPSSYRTRLGRHRPAPGAFKVDWALDGPIPWRAEACSRAATVHVGGSLEEIAASEARANRGELGERPFVIVAQPTLFDPTRAPPGLHTAWAYCHVPHGATEDRTRVIEEQIERFAPGFRDRILACSAFSPADFGRMNENMQGGDITGGANDWVQLFARPVVARVPYRTPMPHTYLCSSFTPPGGGVHGMCGHLAARTALRDTFGRR